MISRPHLGSFGLVQIRGSLEDHLTRLGAEKLTGIETRVFAGVSTIGWGGGVVDLEVRHAEILEHLVELEDTNNQAFKQRTTLSHGAGHRGGFVHRQISNKSQCFFVVFQNQLEGPAADLFAGVPGPVGDLLPSRQRGEIEPVRLTVVLRWLHVLDDVVVGFVEWGMNFDRSRDFVVCNSCGVVIIDRCHIRFGLLLEYLPAIKWHRYGPLHRSYRSNVLQRCRPIDCFVKGLGVEIRIAHHGAT